MATPNIVSGGISTMADLGKDEAWLQGWLKDKPARLGLGDLSVADGEPVQDDGGNPAFLATDGDRYFSVDVRLGEMDASAGFQLLDNWARNRVGHPDKTHVAVLVTETAGDRYRPTLETLSEHLPLVVVELQVWRGENEAILVPHVSLSSKDVDLGETPAAKAAEAAKSVVREAPAAAVAAIDPEPEPKPEPEPQTPVVESVDEDAAMGAEATAAVEASSDRSDETPENKDDTGIADPWGLPPSDRDNSSSASSRLLSKIGS